MDFRDQRPAATNAISTRTPAAIAIVATSTRSSVMAEELSTEAIVAGGRQSLVRPYQIFDSQLTDPILPMPPLIIDRSDVVAVVGRLGRAPARPRRGDLEIVLAFVIQITE